MFNDHREESSSGTAASKETMDCDVKHPNNTVCLRELIVLEHGGSICVLNVFLCYRLDLSLFLYHIFCIYKCNPPDRICVLSLYNDRAVV